MLKSGNSKMVHPDSKAQYIGVISLPAGITCRPDAPCMGRGNCYAFNYPMCLHQKPDGPYGRNLSDYLNNPNRFFENLEHELYFTPFRWVRWHDTGDIPDERYLEGMFSLAKKFQEIRFLCMTKKFELVNAFLDNNHLPPNLVIMLSNWGYWRVSNPHNLPTTEVRFGDERDSVIPETHFGCTKNCAVCNENHYFNGINNCFYAKSGDVFVFDNHAR